MRSLSALLSQALVAFTVEFDNEFERLMGEAGYAGARLSLLVWSNLVRFVGGGVSVRQLAAQALAPDSAVKFELGCLERWGFVALRTADLADLGPRPGWGSGRGLRADTAVSLTAKGLAASLIWPRLFGEIEGRWERRFGAREIGGLRRSLAAVVDRLDAELPQALPAVWLEKYDFPPRAAGGGFTLGLPALLSQALLAFRLEFDREAPAPLRLCANTLRVLGEGPVRMAEIPRLTGGSPETTAIGWQVKPYVVVEPDPEAKRGKVVRLSARGVAAREAYERLIAGIEERWEARFGAEAVARLRDSLLGLFRLNEAGKPLIAEGLAPPEGTVRAGSQAPALGRRDVGAAARQRMRGLAAQTETWVRDPAGSLPHYPLWDMNRGFGP